MTFRFVGSETQIGHVVLKTFGQSIELDAATAKEIIAHEHGAPLLPDAGFTGKPLVGRRNGDYPVFALYAAQPELRGREQVRVQFFAPGVIVSGS